MDFCAGIGGGRLGLSQIGMNCVAFSEINKSAETAYRVLYGDSEINYGDLMNISPCELPCFDVMVGGFPCQSFSIIGKREGFVDARGQIISGLLKILSTLKTPYFILENVKGLVNHDNGHTLKTILDMMKQAGYQVEWQILDSQYYGVPQMRERIYFVGIRKDLVVNETKFKFPEAIKTPSLQDYLIDVDNSIVHIDSESFQKYINNKYNKGKFNIKTLLKEDRLVIDTRQSDLRLYRGKIPTLRTGRHGILYVKDGQLLKLSGFEALLLQGFPKELAYKAKTNTKDNVLLALAGNAMTVSVISEIGKQLLALMNKQY